MTVVYGQTGKPVGSIDGDALYNAVGEQLAENQDGLLFFVQRTRETSEGEFAGSFVNGVIYNAYGIPQAFTDRAQKGVPLLASRTGALVNRIRSTGANVEGKPAAAVPSFLREKLPDQVISRDGLFS